MKTKTKQSLAVLALTAVMTATAFSASAETKNVHLSVNESVAYSDNTSSSKQKTFNGSNAQSSKHKVYVIAQNYGGKIWHTQKSYLLDNGCTTNGAKGTGSISENRPWRLELNPNGPGLKNCTADGSIW